MITGGLIADAFRLVGLPPAAASDVPVDRPRPNASSTVHWPGLHGEPMSRFKAFSGSVDDLKNKTLH